MNDRLMIAAMLAAGECAKSEWPREPEQRYIDNRVGVYLRLSDDLLAAAWEPFPVKTGCDDCRERAEASESKLAACERRLEPLTLDEARMAWILWKPSYSDDQALSMQERDIACMEIRARRA